MFDISLYNDEFFEWHLKHAREYSIKTMDWYIEKYQPKSVLDIGCGIGSYLESAHNHGIPCTGIDISREAQKYTPFEIRPFIRYEDCSKPYVFIKPFDTVISLETAEHIDPDSTDVFIQNLVYATGKHLLFTAAPPGQEGTGHINLHPREFWINQLTKRFVHPSDYEKPQLKYDEDLTKDISDNWRILGAPDYICNNLIVCTR